MKRIFLGGTCAGSKWRDGLMPILDNKGIEYFNPVVEKWDDEAQQREDEEKNVKCGTLLFVITPEQKGPYSYFEIADAMHKVKNGEKDFLIFCVMNSEKWEKHMTSAFKKMIADINRQIPNKCIAKFIDSVNQIFE